MSSPQAQETDALLNDPRNGRNYASVEARSQENKPDEDEEVTIPDVTLRNEATILVKYSGPLVLTYFLQYTFQVIIIVVAARLSTEELAAVSLGITTANITGFAVFEGMATALDTLCSQAYGSSRLHEVGLYTIRGTALIHLVAVLPVSVLWLCSGPIIGALVPTPTLAEHASSFLHWTLIGVPGFVCFEHGKRFMQAQSNFNAALFALLVALPINIALTYLLTEVFHMRVAGAALASSITNTLRPVLLAVYAVFVNPSTLKCWPSSKEIREGWRNEWGLFARLAIPGALMTLSEWLCFEILTFCTAYVGTAALAAQTFLGTAVTLVWHIPFAASVACSTRVGQLVGAGMTQDTGKVMKWYALIFLTMGVIDAFLGVGIVLGIQRFLVHDANVARILQDALPWMAIFAIFDATTNWPHSIVRGFGWQDIGAWCTVLINYLWGVPLSIFLELGPPLLGISGLWIGLGSGLALTTAVEALFIWRRLRKTADGRISI